MSHLHPLMAQALRPFAPESKPMRIFRVKINNTELRVLARTSTDAILQVIEPFLEDGDIPELRISAKAERK